MRMVSATETRVTRRTWRGEYGRTEAGEVTTRQGTPRKPLTLAERRRRAFGGQ